MATTAERPKKVEKSDRSEEIKARFAANYPDAHKIGVTRISTSNYRVNVFIEVKTQADIMFIKNIKIGHSEVVTAV
jgi:hypothetical protein